MNQISFSYKDTKSFIKEDEIDKMKRLAMQAKKDLEEKTGPGNDFLGWVNLPVEYDKEEFQRIKEAAKRIQNHSKVFVVIGIGGSYLGSRAAISFLGNNFENRQRDEERKTPEIYFAGNNISGSYLADLMDVIGDRDFSVNVISKSGTTTEPAIAFRVLKEKLEKKYGTEGASKRIFATTDREKGALKNLALKNGYETFTIPDDVGGRFTVLTPVGLLPIAVSGANLDQLLAGAQSARIRCLSNDYEENDSLLYASVRNLLLRRGKAVEILANYEPRLHYMAEWWKQLMGESEGKDGKGLYPSSVDLSTDLHSLGQFIQDGSNITFETIMNVEKTSRDITIKKEKEDLDGLNYLAGRDMAFVNKNAMLGTIIAHVKGGVPNLMITIPEINEYYLGELFYFFEYACGISGYLLGVNPFDQPGVEEYKRNMFMLLGKPGYEKQ